MTFHGKFFGLVCMAGAIAVMLANVANGQSLRLATYNLNFANQRGDQVLSAIAEADADLICFQETTIQSEGFLKKQLASTHPYFYSVGHEGKYYAERFAYASKSELAKLKFFPPSRGLFGFYFAQLKLKEEWVQVVNVHLSPVQLQRGSGFSDALNALSSAEEIHTQEIEAIVKEIDWDRPAVVLGDFNSISTFVAPKRLSELGMSDVVAELHSDADGHVTWTWPTRPVPLSLRIDYIFCSKHFTASQAAVIQRIGSDHSLVVATLNDSMLSEDVESTSN